MSTAGMDPDMVALLSDEERAAIDESDISTEELDAMKEIVGDDDEGDEDEGNEQDGDGVDPDQAASDKVNSDTDPAAGDNTEGEAEPAADAPAETFAPRYQAELPADFEEKTNGLNQESMALAKQFKDGEIDFDEYNQKISDINARRDELNTARIKAEIAAEMNSQSLEQQWVDTVKNFNAQVAKEIDYANDQAKAGELDTFIKVFAAKPENADKPMRWFLDEGHKCVKALHGIGDVKPSGGEKQDAKTVTNRKPPVEAAPKTLAQVPGSDGPGDLAGEFADLDNLEGMELEQAIARMSPAQRERYAKS